MARNLVVCCDGTANEFARHHTNVVKLYSTLVHDDPAQCTYYHPGIGTMEPPGALTPLARRVTRGLGMALGAYLENDIRDAYAFLMQTFKEDDRVFMFGFSRGAYTVRCVASLLRMYGLLRPGNEALVPYAIRMMMAIQKARDTRGTTHADTTQEYFELAARFKQTMARECKPWFIGVWDTVSSVGWKENPLKLPFTAGNSDIAIGRHAIALDERRAFFRTNLWRPDPKLEATNGPKDLLQVWFPGVHSDVGGGYPEQESGLSKLALDWMLDEAEPHGLLVNQQRKAEVLGGAAPFVKPDANGMMHESLKRAWKLAEFIRKPHFDRETGRTERRANRSRRRTIPRQARIHWSVFERGGNYAQGLQLPPDHERVPKPPGKP
jgi:uncharacterized protein (DUF2235 family)